MRVFQVGLYPTDDIQYSKDTENQIFLLTLSSLPPLCSGRYFIFLTLFLVGFRHPIAIQYQQIFCLNLSWYSLNISIVWTLMGQQRHSRRPHFANDKWERMLRLMPFVLFRCLLSDLLPPKFSSSSSNLPSTRLGSADVTSGLLSTDDSLHL